MALALAVADRQDGSGATATVTGTSSGAWSIWTQPQNRPGAAWRPTASGVGDGTAILATIGYFWAYLSSGASLTPVIQYVATIAAAAIVCRCRDAYAAILAGKTFTPQTGGTTPGIVTQKAANVLQTNLPVIILSLEGLAEQPAGEPWAFESEDMTGYRVGVMIADHASRLLQNADTYMLWRQTAMLALQGRCVGDGLSGVPELYQTVIEAGPQIESELKKTQMPNYMGMGSGFVVRAECVSIRG